MEHLIRYVAICLRYKWIILSISVGAMVFIVLFSIVSMILPPEKSPMPNYYYAYSALLVSQNSDIGGTNMMLSALGIDVLPGAGTDYGQISQQVLQSRSFLDRIIEEYDLRDKYGSNTLVQSQIRHIVTLNMTSEYNSQTGVLTIGYQDTNPEFAMNITNSIVDNLQDWFKERGGLNHMNELATSEQRIKEVEMEMARLESAILAFQREYGVFSVEEIAQSQSTMLADLQAQLVELEVQIKNQEAFSLIEDDPALARLRLQRVNVGQLIYQIENGYTGGVRTTPARTELPELALEFQRLQTNLEIQARIYQTVVQQYEVARLNADSEPAFTVLEYAEIPDEKAGPSRGRLSMTVTLAGFFGSIVLAFLIHYIRETDFFRRFLDEIRNPSN